MILHADERRKIVIDSIVLHRVELPRPAGAHADVAHVTGLDNIVECLHLKEVSVKYGLAK